jgi:hypothetical protein
LEQVSLRLRETSEDVCLESPTPGGGLPKTNISLGRAFGSRMLV